MLTVGDLFEAEKYTMESRIEEVLVKVNVEYIDTVFVEYEVSKLTECESSKITIEASNSLNQMLTSYLANGSFVNRYLNEIIDQSIVYVKTNLSKPWMSSTTIRDILIDRISIDLATFDFTSWDLDFELKFDVSKIEHNFQ